MSAKVYSIFVCVFITTLIPTRPHFSRNRLLPVNGPMRAEYKNSEPVLSFRNRTSNENHTRVKHVLTVLTSRVRQSLPIICVRKGTFYNFNIVTMCSTAEVMDLIIANKAIPTQCLPTTSTTITPELPPHIISESEIQESQSFPRTLVKMHDSGGLAGPNNLLSFHVTWSINDFATLVRS